MTRLAICLVFFSVFSSFFAKAQTQDTIIDNKPYAIHVVQPRETLYGISRQYNAELNDLVVSNPAVIQGLHVGFHLLVPLRHDISKPLVQIPYFLIIFLKNCHQMIRLSLWIFKGLISRFMN